MSETIQKKISVAMCANSLGINGISTVIMNYCSNIDLKKYDISILAGSPIADIHRETCNRLGIYIVELPARKTSSRAYYLALNKVLAQNRYDIFHIHGNSATITVELLLTKLHGTKIRIAHSHNTTCTSMKAHKLLSPIFHHIYTHGFACGEDAGKWLFQKRKFHVIPNGFHTEEFKYQAQNRRRIRKELGLQGKFVIGHIGRFNEQKNQPFLIEAFKIVAQKREDAYLLLVGIGPDFEKTKSLINLHPYKERIIVYGESKEAAAMYAAMDVFVMPSIYEGLPVVLLEAQINGLPCIVSDTVTKEVVLGNRIKRYSLKESYEQWADLILGAEQIDREEFYSSHIDEIEHYHIDNDVKILDQLYTNFYIIKNKKK